VGATEQSCCIVGQAATGQDVVDKGLFWGSAGCRIWAVWTRVPVGRPQPSHASRAWV